MDKRLHWWPSELDVTIGDSRNSLLSHDALEELGEH